MPPEGAPLLKAAGVDAGYGTMQVLWGVDLDVRAGETVLLLGANGAGKTTFLKSLVGLIEVRQGSIKLGDKDLTRMRSSDRRWGMPIPAPASRKCIACFRHCAKNAGRRRRAFPAGNARCWALPRRLPPNRGCW